MEEKERGLFTDGVQSLQRLVIGMCISFVPSLVFPICVAYQIVSPIGSSDLQEVLCGYVIGAILYGFAKVSLMMHSIIG